MVIPWGRNDVVHPGHGLGHHAPMDGLKHHIFICINQRPPDDPRGCCAANGSVELHACFKREVRRLGLKGLVRANKAGCLDHCKDGPSLVIYPEGVWYRVRNETDVVEIMERHVVKGQLVERLLMPGHPPPPRTSESRAVPRPR